MKLIEILKDIKTKEIIGNSDIEIDNLSQDTREDFTQNTLYFAVPGTQVDGHDFIEQAIENGSVAVVCEYIPTVIARSGAEHGLDSRFRGNDNDEGENLNQIDLTLDSLFRGNDKNNEKISDQVRNDNERELPAGRQVASILRNDNVTFIIVDSVSEVMGQMVSNFYRNPSDTLEIIAVTGTNGKTTIATILYQSFLKLGKKAALFSTAGDYINGQEIETKKKASSSMEIIEFQKNLARAVEEKCEYVCIEATSHALDQNRLNGTKIRGAIFTNLTQDHLDYHQNLNDYAQAKQKLFSLLNENSFALVNIDDSYGAMMAEKTPAKIITYGNADYDNPIRRDITFKIRDFSITGTKVLLENNEAQVQLVGTFNMYNTLAVYGALKELGFAVQDIIDVLSQIKGARGRMEIVRGKSGAIGIVDYAHTPDALQNVLETLNELPHNKIITVVGAGGDRDKAKRPQMARIAQEKSDYVILTSDNPRTEDPQFILKDMEAGCDAYRENYEIIEDREEAIKRAVDISEDKDIILVAGKGHEDYQIIGTTKHHFDDREVLEKYL